jgi:beta-glucosidase
LPVRDRRNDPSLPDSDRDDVASVCNGAPWKCVVVVAAGRPVNMSSIFDSGSVDAVVHAWLPGSEGGQAVVNKLFALPGSAARTYTYEGRLPITWRRDLSDGPTSSVLFPYGYGCSTRAKSSRGGVACGVSKAAQRALLEGKQAVDGGER